MKNKVLIAVVVSAIFGFLLSFIVFEWKPWIEAPVFVETEPCEIALPVERMIVVAKGEIISFDEERITIGRLGETFSAKMSPETRVSIIDLTTIQEMGGSVEITQREILAEEGSLDDLQIGKEVTLSVIKEAGVDFVVSEISVTK